jgi:hypothetical protein
LALKVRFDPLAEATTPVMALMLLMAVAMFATVVLAAKLSCWVPRNPAISSVVPLAAVPAPVNAILPCVALLATWTTTLWVVPPGRLAALIWSVAKALAAAALVV